MKMLQQMLANVAEAAAQAGDTETHPLLLRSGRKSEFCWSCLPQMVDWRARLIPT